MSSTKKGVLTRLRCFIRDQFSFRKVKATNLSTVTAVPVQNIPVGFASVAAPVSDDAPPPIYSRNSNHRSDVSNLKMGDLVDSMHTEPSGTKTSTPKSIGKHSQDLDIGLNGIHEFLKVVKEFSEVFSPLKSAVGGIVACIDAYKRTTQNHDEMERLLDSINRVSSLAVARLRDHSPKATNQGIVKLGSALDVERKKINAMEERGVLARLAQNAHDGAELVASYRSIKDALDEFQLELGLAVEKNTREILKNVVFQSLHRSESAAFTAAIDTNTVTRGPCTYGTRVGVIEEIYDWVISDNISVAPVYWLNGLAGTGKTTLAYTMCQRLEAANIPFVSFFCSRQLDSRDTTLLVPTICRDLAELFQSYAAEVVPVLETDSKLARAIIPLQITKLLAWPWRDSHRQRDGLRAPVVIVDALDESDAGSEFLQELLRVVHDGALPGIKFLVTSRPDPDVVKLCESFPPGAVCHLHEVATEEVGEDISKFLEEKLPNLRGKPELEMLSQRSGGLFIYAATIVRFLSPRPILSSQEQLAQLQALLDTWPTSGKTRETLLLDQLYQQVLANAFTFSNFTIEQKRIAVLHTIICAEYPMPISVIAELASETCDQEMVSSVINSLHATMYISTKDQCVYWYHQSFADFVFSSDRANSIPRKSPSFANIPFNAHCEPPVSHALLAASCFRVMRGLRFNICELESSFLLDREVPDLEERADKKISQTLRYASKHWASHLHRVASSYANSLYEDLRDFLHNRFLFWMEAVNLISARSVCRQQVHLLQQWLQQVPSKDLLDYVADVSRFVAHFSASAASLSTPHLYISSLATWPPSSPIMETWRSRFSKIPLFLHPEGVSALPLVSMRAHSSLHPFRYSRDSFSIVLSGDGARVASKGQHGVWVWDATTGELLRHWQGDISAWLFESLAISYHGTRVASSTVADRHVTVWDVSTGEQLWQMDHCFESLSTFMKMSRDCTLIVYVADARFLQLWEEAMMEAQERKLRNSVAQSRSLTSVEPVECSVRLLDAKICACLSRHHLYEALALSHDGTTLVAAGHDFKLFVWNSVGQQLWLKGHTSPVTCVALSGDGTRIASGSDDRSVRIWDPLTGLQLRQLDGHNLKTCSIGLSHDGSRIATLAPDGYIRIWDGTSKEYPTELLDGHTDILSSVALSHDATHIVSRSRDQSLQLWDVASGRQLWMLDYSDLPYSIESVAISHDGTRIVSACGSFLWVWDPIRGEKLRQINWQDIGERWVRYYRPFMSVAVSPDRIVSGGSHGSVRLWNMGTGKHLAHFVGHHSEVKSVSISATGGRIAAASDFCVQVWDTSTRVELWRIVVPLCGIRSVALSHDGTRVVSGDYDGRVKLLDGTTGKQLRLLTGHTGVVHSVALSHDGSRIVSGSDDHSVRIWDGISGVQLKQLHGHLGPVSSVALSSDGTTIVSGADDCCIRIWGNLTTDIPWVVDEDGWIVYGSERFMWLSPDLRQLFLYPHCIRLISRRGYTTVDFTHSKIGTDWHECHTPE